VVLDDLVGGQVRPVGGGVTVQRHDRRVAPCERAAHGRIHAIIRCAAGYDELVDGPRTQQLVEPGVQERIARLLADVQVAVPHLQSGKQVPARQIRMVRVAGRPVMLDEDDGAAGGARCLGQMVQPVDETVGVMLWGRGCERPSLHVYDDQRVRHAAACPGGDWLSYTSAA